MRGFKKTSIALLLILNMVLFVGCGGSNSTTTNADALQTNNIAFMAYQSEPVLDWDPSSATSNEIIIFHNVYETLTRYNAETGDVDPLIAESYQVSDDGLHWTFNIRHGMKFHDGTDVNAQAVKFSIDRTMEKNLGSAYIWDAVKSIEVVDDYTVKFNLTYPTALQFVASSGYAAFIMSPTAVEANSDDWFTLGNEAGSGPYKLRSSKMGEEVVLEAFDDYWGGWEDNQYKTVVVKKIAESSSRRQLIESGEMTITEDLPSEDVDALEKNDNVKIYAGKTFTNLMFHMNTEVAPLDNKLVRQALSYAFPYEDVIKYAAGGRGVQSQGVIPDGIIGHDKSIKQYSFDLEKAKALLDEAGVSEGEISLDLNYLSGDELQKKTAELYKSELNKIGVELNIRSMPWDSYLEIARSPNPEDRQDLFAIYWWPDNALPSSWFHLLYYSEDNISWNMSYYDDAEYDSLIDEADAILFKDEAKATKLYEEANNKIMDEALSLVVMDVSRVFVANPTLKGFEPNPAYDSVVFFYDCYKE